MPLYTADKRNVKFCLLVCGRSNSGKSTFVNSLCNQTVYCTSHSLAGPGHIDKGQAIVETDTATVSLTALVVRAFGNLIDNRHLSSEVTEYVDQSFDEIISEESKTIRNPHFPDRRIHAAVYLITATSKGLCELDIEMMKAIGSRINLIPVIAKADSLTDDELMLNKLLIMKDIAFHDIPIFNFETVAWRARNLQSLVPFALSCSMPNEQGHAVREYPWGQVDVNDPAQSDFPTLKSILLDWFLPSLKNSTHCELYEKYRRRKLI